MRTFFRVGLLLLLTVAAKADTFNYTFIGESFNLSGTPISVSSAKVRASCEALP